MTTMRQVIDAVGTRLTQAGIAYWPGPTGSYANATPGVPHVFAKRLPPKPETVIAINTYGTTLDPNPSLTGIAVVRVQVRTRAPTDADTIGDQITAALHGQHHQEWAGLHVDRCRHLSTAQLGADSAGLDERTDNFEITFHTRS